ncbi:MAG TPA: IS481 family transposase [Gemmatimonadales bacterium]|jgi:transposase InsO family protein|nr:IS481 family transposase [Gemmatimonadales bacterium]
MPWDETTRMSQRLRFIIDFESCQSTMTALCERYGISRKTGYKWAERYAKEGPGGLEDRPHLAKSFPHQLGAAKVEGILSLRHRFPRWGPRKLQAWLERHHPEESWPAASTIGDLLKRHGLVESRSFRRRPPAPSAPRVEATGPNEVWSSDFKGQFRLGNARLCYPLTVADGFSRYLLGCEGLASPSGGASKLVFERLFRQYGLPRAILTDNGSPFASSRSLSRLSQLSVWWIKLGIRPLLIQPGHPEQNGRHERMHRTLKAETVRPPSADAPRQQERFEEFRHSYNEQRPHEALGQLPPTELYERSPRAYPSRLQPWEYLGHFEVRRVRHTGEIRWKGESLFVSQSLQGERIGLEEVDEGQWSVYLGPVLIARFDEQERKMYG